MSCPEKSDQRSTRRGDDVDIGGIVRSVAEQFSIVFGKQERVAQGCADLECSLSTPPTPSDLEHLASLLPILAEHSGPLVLPVYELLERVAATCRDPWPLLKGMIAAKDPSLVQHSLQCALRCVEAGSLSVDRELVRYLATLLDVPNTRIGNAECLPLLGSLVRQLRRSGVMHSRDPVEALFLTETDGSIRRLAALILDAPGGPLPMELAEEALGNDDVAFLGPYLAYSRASHADFLSILPQPGAPPPVLPSLHQAETALGAELLRQVIARIGWPGMNLNLDVRHYTSVTSGDALPLMLFPAEARLARKCGEARKTADLFIVIAHGGSTAEGERMSVDRDPAQQFREYNLAHADVLKDFLAVAPLTTERILSILERMEKIVGEFVGLFASMSEECSILPGIFEGIRRQILEELREHRDGEPLPPDLTRLTVMFEDPQAPGEVHTLHGLKRYLHQKGLRLGFNLVQRTLSTNRTVVLLVCSRKRILKTLEGIRYADFEPGTESAASRGTVPYAVALVAEGFVRQLLYGHDDFPRVDIFCYGTEIHYFLAYGNHPAFLRINFSPPLQGGMIDLEYYGVSKYELSGHPDVSLGALQRFFRSLGFHVLVENTRVHARYDKEHTADLRSLCERAEELFCLAPYLLDIDWTIGGLRLDGDARQQVAAAWAEAFAAWGVLPLRFLLTKNRQGVVESIVEGPEGRRPVQWQGAAPYRDLFRSERGELFHRLFAAAQHLSPEIPGAPPAAGRPWIGQLELERSLLLPLRRAVARGELSECPTGFQHASPETFGKMSEPELFAELVSSGDGRLTAAATLAYLIGSLERFLGFRTAGTVGPHDVQSARLSLPEEDLGIHVMRGEQQNASLAFYTRGVVLYRRRNSPTDSWSCNAAFDTAEFLASLRRANYPVPGLEHLPSGLPDEVRRIQQNLAHLLPIEPRRPIPGERTVAGVRATPGRAVGRVLFSMKDRRPEEFADAILVTPALQPSDGALLNRAAGVVSTGGGILSHAALLAAQFGKPAIIITGQWEADPDRAAVLHYTSTAYELEEGEAHGCQISTRKRVREYAHVLQEGDLVVIDPKEDLLRVLGQDPDALALHEELRQFGRASQDLVRVTSDRDRLLFRGRKVRARHQIEKVLTRLVDPVLTCHAIDELVQASERLNVGVAGDERARLLRLMLNNPRVASTAERHLRRVVRELHRDCQTALAELRSRIPTSDSLFEVLALRLDAKLALRALGEVHSVMLECGVAGLSVDLSMESEIDQRTHHKLEELRERIETALETSDPSGNDARRRHLLRQLERAEALVGAPEREKIRVAVSRAELSASDARAAQRLAGRTEAWPGDGGFELFDVIGWKAANLAELGRIAGEQLVPPWFVVTDCAFRHVMESPRERIFGKGIDLPQGAPTLGKAIEVVLSQSRLDRFQKASLIRSLWASVVLPESITEDIIAAYRQLGTSAMLGGRTGISEPEPLVALRSSSREEDAEIAARAGEFDTYLFIHGEQALLHYLLLTWSGLWSDRALHTREMLGTTTSVAGGGVIVQQIVNARVSGVLQTINVARNDFRQMVINAGWGLGEGVVSGTVAADQIVVSKEGDLERGPLRFNYVTADKRDYVVFDKRAGIGTTRCEAPYHQRLRPALEYAELCELVAVAARLESAYGYPLDIEFGFEASRLWVLQARPVPTAHAILQETLQHYPLSLAGKTVHSHPGRSAP